MAKKSKSSDNVTLIVGGIIIALGILSIPYYIATKPGEAKELLTNQGFQNVETRLSWQTFRCSRDDYFVVYFEATKDNNPIHGWVCSAPLKGSTIRF